MLIIWKGITNNICVDTADIKNFGSPQGGGYTLRPGAPCTGTGGYCDYFSVCRSYDANTVFAKLTQTLLRIPQLTIDDVKKWAQVTQMLFINCFITIILSFMKRFCHRSVKPSKTIFDTHRRLRIERSWTISDGMMSETFQK